jgi:hypothetical protein
MADDLTAVEIPIKDFLCDECRPSARSPQPRKAEFRRFIHEEETKEGAKVNLFVSDYHCEMVGPGRFEASFEFDLPPCCPTCRIRMADPARISKKMLGQLLSEIACHPQPLASFTIKMMDPQNDSPRVSVKGSMVCPECCRQPEK